MNVNTVAGRTLMHTLLTALERVAFNGDPLQFMLVSTTYQPFISFFHQTKAVKENPELAAIPNHGSALAIELRRAPPPDVDDGSAPAQLLQVVQVVVGCGAGQPHQPRLPVDECEGLRAVVDRHRAVGLHHRWGQRDAH